MPLSWTLGISAAGFVTKKPSKPPNRGKKHVANAGALTKEFLFLLFPKNSLPVVIHSKKKMKKLFVCNGIQGHEINAMTVDVDAQCKCRKFVSSRSDYRIE